MDNLEPRGSDRRNVYEQRTGRGMRRLVTIILLLLIIVLVVLAIYYIAGRTTTTTISMLNFNLN